jgi:hypothetical protein
MKYVLQLGIRILIASPTSRIGVWDVAILKQLMPPHYLIFNFSSKALLSAALGTTKLTVFTAK